jgi:hypothetical protein
MLAVQDLAVRSWEDEPLLAIVEPDEVGRGPVVAADLDNLGSVVRRAHLRAMEEKPLTDLNLHANHLLATRIGAPAPTAQGLTSAGVEDL